MITICANLVLVLLPQLAAFTVVSLLSPISHSLQSAWSWRSADCSTSVERMISVRNVYF